MGSLVSKLCGVAVGVLILSGCAGGAGTDGSTATAGAIELAVSETCVPDSTPECLAVNGEHLVVPSTGFSRAEVESVVVADDQQANVVDVTLSSEGAEILAGATTQVSQAGDSARLVIRAGNQVLAAPTVAQPLNGDQVQIVLPAELSPEEFIERVGQA